MDCNNTVLSTISDKCPGENITTDGGNELVMVSTKSLQESFNKVQYFLCPLLFIVGISGNCLTILTVTRPRFRLLTSRYILCALAISDSLLLCTNPFNQQFMLTLVKKDIRALSDAACKFFFIVYRTGKMSSSWFIVMITFERFVAVLFPLNVRSIMTKKSILLGIACIYIVMFAITGTWSFSTAVFNDLCLSDVVTMKTYRQHKSFVIVGAVFYSIAPFTILMAITPPIIVKLVRQHHRRQILQHISTNRSARETHKITIMLISIVVLYIICVTPITLVLILTFWTGEPFFNSDKKEFIILTSVAQWLEQINHSMNFSMYVLCSRQFRERFLEMIGCVERPRDDLHIATIPDETHMSPSLTSTSQVTDHIASNYAISGTDNQVGLGQQMF